MHHVAHFLVYNVLAKFQIPIVLHHYLQRYSLFCVLTSILSHLMTSSVPNLHKTKILNISGTRGDMTKRKMPFFFTFKGLSNKPFFNSPIFHFIGTLIIIQNNIRNFMLGSSIMKKRLIACGSPGWSMNSTSMEIKANSLKSLNPCTHRLIVASKLVKALSQKCSLATKE